MKIVLPFLYLTTIASHLMAASELYISAGQSNMAGLGGITEVKHTTPNPKLSFRAHGPWRNPNPEWEHSAGKAPADLGAMGVGPWWAFGEMMSAAKPDRDIYVLNLAVAGSPLKEWIKGGIHYEANLPIIQKAIEEGMELKGFIWHQGESGTGLAAGEKPEYQEMFVQMAGDYRSALKVPNLPVVAGSLGNEGVGGPVNEALANLVGQLPHYSFVVTKNRTLSDNVHYDAPSCEHLGVELAKSMLTLQGIPVPAALPATLTFKPEIQLSIAAVKRVIPVVGDTSTCARPEVNLGLAPRLYLEKTRSSYLRFVELPTGIKKATLVLYARAVPGASATITTSKLTADFDEKTLVPTNAPAAAGSKVETAVSVAEGVVVIDVTSLLVPGDQTLSLVLSSDVLNNSIVLDSREGDWAPRLVIE